MYTHAYKKMSRRPKKTYIVIRDTRPEFINPAGVIDPVDDIDTDGDRDWDAQEYSYDNIVKREKIRAKREKIRAKRETMKQFKSYTNMNVDVIGLIADALHGKAIHH